MREFNPMEHYSISVMICKVAIPIQVVLFSCFIILLTIVPAVEEINKSFKVSAGPDFTDPRDGKKYKTVIIDSQTWMAQNLDYHGYDGYLGLCYGDKPQEKIRKPENCEQYGRLYDWSEAMKACPKGWHLPSEDEWNTLGNFVQNDYSKYDFSVLPGGYGTSNGNFYNVGDIECWWSASEYDSRYLVSPSQGLKQSLWSASRAHYRSMSYSGMHCGDGDKSNLYSVRCLQGSDQAKTKEPESEPKDEMKENSLNEILNRGSGLSGGESEENPFNRDEQEPSAGLKDGKTMYVNDVKGLNMRSEPSTDGVKLGTLFYGTKVKVLEKSSTPVKIGDITDYWYKIDAKAWVFGGYLSEKPPKEGTLTDSRDGKVYRKVKIGKQTWMAENLNYEAAGSCYDDKPENCEKYGSLYGRNFSDCPAGWHLPSKEEYEVLIKTVPGDAGKKLKAKSGWNDDDGKPINGTDDFGFSALPGGDGSGGWWTASSDGYCSDGTCFELPYYLEFSKHDSWRFDFDYNVIGGSSAMFSVRCIQD